MSLSERVLIAGAGPVGLVAAANLVQHRIPVTVLEAGSDLSDESRASTFHPPTLDMLDDLGVTQDLIAQGLRAPKFQYRSRKDGLIAQFDFAAIDDVTRHQPSPLAAIFGRESVLRAKRFVGRAAVVRSSRLGAA